MGLTETAGDSEANQFRTQSPVGDYNDVMVARLEKTEKGYAILLTEEMVRELDLREGAEVEVLPVAEPTERPQIRYASKEEVLAAFERTLPRHEEAYRELAK